MSREEATVEMASEEDVSDPGVMAAVASLLEGSPRMHSFPVTAVVAGPDDGTMLEEVKVRDKEDAADDGVWIDVSATAFEQVDMEVLC